MDLSVVLINDFAMVCFKTFSIKPPLGVVKIYYIIIKKILCIYIPIKNGNDTTDDTTEYDTTEWYYRNMYA